MPAPHPGRLAPESHETALNKKDISEGDPDQDLPRPARFRASGEKGPPAGSMSSIPLSKTLNESVKRKATPFQTRPHPAIDPRAAMAQPILTDSTNATHPTDPPNPHSPKQIPVPQVDGLERETASGTRETMSVYPKAFTVEKAPKAATPINISSRTAAPAFVGTDPAARSARHAPAGGPLPGAAEKPGDAFVRSTAESRTNGQVARGPDRLVAGGQEKQQVTGAGFQTDTPSEDDRHRMEIAAPSATRLHAPAVDAGRGHAPSAAPLPPGPSQETLRQMADALHRAPDGKLELTLRPEELGRLRMTLTPHDNGISVTIHADRVDTVDLMRRHIDQLGQEFRDLGYRDIRFDFGQGGQQRQSPPQSPAPTSDSGEELPPPPPPSPKAASSTRPATGALDLRI